MARPRERFEVHRGIAAPPAFVAGAYFWVTSAEEFGATLARHGADIYRDIANFTKPLPIRGWAELA